MAHALYNTLRTITLTAALAGLAGCSGIIYNGRELPKPIPAASIALPTVAPPVVFARAVTDTTPTYKPVQAPTPAPTAVTSTAPAKHELRVKCAEPFSAADSIYTSKKGDTPSHIACRTLSPAIMHDSVDAQVQNDSIAAAIHRLDKLNNGAFGKDIGYMTSEGKYIRKAGVDKLPDQLGVGVTIKLYDTSAQPAVAASAPSTDSLSQKLAAAAAADSAARANLAASISQRDSAKAQYDSLTQRLAQLDSSVTKLRADSAAARTAFTADSVAYKALQDSLAAQAAKAPVLTDSTKATPTAPPADSMQPGAASVTSTASPAEMVALQARIARLEDMNSQWRARDSSWLKRDSVHTRNARIYEDKINTLERELQEEKSFPWLPVTGVVSLAVLGAGALYLVNRRRRSGANGERGPAHG